MLSYQHAYHAGNLADIHKHAALACMMEYLTQKDKPLTYIETHAGRGLYDLTAYEAQKTGEAALGILRFLQAERIPADHPYMRVVSHIHAQYGACAYPGSPMVAAHYLRPEDKMHLAEMHPQEVEALRANMSRTQARITKKDGLKHANRITPPDPRRGVMVIDPSYEIKSEYTEMAQFVQNMHSKWNIGIIMLWYPLLKNGAHIDMIQTLEAANLKDFYKHEVSFSHLNNPAHGMMGSGLLFVNTPFGMQEKLQEISGFFI
jgi:23S rRNA (adenine2030-N6)-methyltransferase